MNNITILNIHGIDNGCITFGISKNEAINLLRSAGLNEKVDHYNVFLFIACSRKDE